MQLTVLVFTFNHEKYVAQALNSILMQDFSSKFEIVVADDCSTDRTREILREYQRRHPEIIRLVLAEKNLNDNQVMVQLIEAAAGKYIALLEGDDFWTSPTKLQKQVAFLDDHPECGMCFHNVNRLYEHGDGHQQVLHNPRGLKTFHTLKDLLNESFIAFGSIICRAGVIGRFPDWFQSVFAADWALCVLYAERAKIGYIDEVMGTYRIHSNGVWSSLDVVGKLEQSIQSNEVMDAGFAGKYHRIFQRNIAFYNFYLAICYAQRRNVADALRCLKATILERPLRGWIPLREIVFAWELLKTRLTLQL